MQTSKDSPTIEDLKFLKTYESIEVLGMYGKFVRAEAYLECYKSLLEAEKALERIHDQVKHKAQLMREQREAKV